MSTRNKDQISIGDYAQRHFVSKFSSKYKKARDTTLEAIVEQILRLEKFLLTSKATMISKNKFGQIIKCEFSVAGSNVSPRNSGNRYIIYEDFKSKKIEILLLYGKDHIPKKKDETVWRKQEIYNNYNTIKSNFPNLVE